MYFSADAHIMEPTDLFTRRLPAEDQFRAPAIHRFDDGRKMLTANTIPVNISPDYFRPKPTAQGGWERIDADDISGYLDDLAADNVWGALLHPNAGLMVFDLDDPRFAIACARIYNDHVAELYQSDRLHPGALIPLVDIDDALEEIDRVAAMGFKAIELPLSGPPEAPYFSHRYDPIWAAAQRHGLPIAMHVGTGARRGSASAAATMSSVTFTAATGTARWPSGHPDHEQAIVAAKTRIGGFGGYGDAALTTIPNLVGGGVTERYPDLHFILVESGARWLLSVMDTMDEAWHKGPGVQEVNREIFLGDGQRVWQFQPDELDLDWPHPLKPSEYVRRQIHVTFQDDWVALRNRTLTGIEPLLWGNDYPHNEGCYPRSVEAVERQAERAGLDGSEREAIFGGTAAALLGLRQPVSV